MTRRRPHGGALGAAAARALGDSHAQHEYGTVNPPATNGKFAEWSLGSNFTVPVFCFWVKEFKALLHPPPQAPWPTETRRTRAW